jgi:Zn-dependent peptidase ImmA (M78 family)/transcriptional regulator with XRE-family HTH domain
MDVDLVATGERVRAARLKAGLSQRALHEQCGLSQPTLQRLESGTPTRVGLEDLDHLAGLVSVSLQDLLYGSAVRERVKVAARSNGAIAVASAQDHAVELLELDDRLDAAVEGLRQRLITPDLSVPTSGTSPARGRVLAGNARAALGLGIGPIFDLPEVLEQLTGVDVGSAPMPDGVSGVCATDPARATSLVLVDSNEVADRQRFTLAHELGHLLFGDRAHVGPADGRRSPLELRCDEFARNLLIPQDGVTAWLTRSVGKAERSLVDERTVARLARHFGVTPDAARVQLDRMHLLQATMTSLPSGRTLAYRYGWGPAFDSEQAAANQPRVPRRLLDRAVEAYRVGRLGVNALARLQGRPVADVELALADAGIVVQPVVRKANMDALLARAVARNAT